MRGRHTVGIAVWMAWGVAGLGAQVNPALLAGMQWRNIGAFRAGRAGAVCGVPGQPGTYYMGAMQGGFWKSSSAGALWTNMTDATVPDVAAINACAVSQSDPNEIFFSSSARGPGLFRSGDGGKTWQKVGPVSGSILIDPRDAKVVILARGGAGGGVFRSTDGGMNFTRTFARDEASGVNTLQWAADNPSVMYATVGAGGGRGGGGARGGAAAGAAAAAGPTFFKSTDEGLTFSPVMTSGLTNLGSFSVAGNTHSQRLYTGGRGGILRSDDGGATWVQQAGASQMATANGQVYADPKNPDLMYILGTAVYRSTDGGKTLAAWKGSPGGDDPREWWIDPTNGNNIEYGGDQGASVSLDGGQSWAPWYNQPTAQIYHLTVDNRFPYWVYGSQQDSGTVATKNRGDFGQINPWDWIPFPGWEGATLAVDPLNPLLVYTNGNYGDLGRVWMDTWDSQIINPAVGHEVLRRGSNSPILFSPQDPHTMYFASQYLMVTHDGAQTFQKASPDLTVKASEAAAAATAPAGRGGRGGASISEFTLSPVKAGVIYAATTNNLLWTTADGKDWQEITPSEWNGSVQNLEASHFDANEAYAAVRRTGGGGGRGAATGDADAPYLYRTRDGGKTWQLITNGLPTGQITGSYANVIREDPREKGLLFAGTETEVHVSFDDGDHWQTLRLNAPNTSYRDLVVHTDPASGQTDVVVCTYGRSFWVLDDIAPLEALAGQSAQVAAAPATLFKPTNAVRLQRDNNYDTPLPPEVAHASNPPEGAILYYNLSVPVSSLKIEIFDAQSRLVRTLSSTPDWMPPDPLGAVPEPWKRVPAGLPTTAGLHRVNWDLRWSTPDAMAFNYDQEMSAIYHDTPASPQGPKAVPGAYTVRMTADGKTYTQPLTVVADPRLDPKTVTLAGMQRQLTMGLQLEAGLKATKTVVEQIAAVREQLKAAGVQTPANAATVTALDQKIATIQGTPNQAISDAYGTVPGGISFSHVSGAMARLLVAVDYNSDMPPVAGQEQGWRDDCGDANTLLTQWKALLAGDLAAYRPALQLPASTPAALACGN